MMTSDFENQLNAIRIELYEQIKDMSSVEAVNAINESGERIAEKYGIVVEKSIGYKPTPSAKAQ